MNLDKNNIDICPICIENLINEEIIETTHCNHKFHHKCYLEYIDYQRRQNKATILCPLCQKILIENQTNNLQPDPSPMFIVIEIPRENSSHIEIQNKKYHSFFLTISCFMLIGYCLWSIDNYQ